MATSRTALGRRGDVDADRALHHGHAPRGWRTTFGHGARAGLSESGSMIEARAEARHADGKGKAVACWRGRGSCLTFRRPCGRRAACQSAVLGAAHLPRGAKQGISATVTGRDQGGEPRGQGGRRRGTGGVGSRLDSAHSEGSKFPSHWSRTAKNPPSALWKGPAARPSKCPPQQRYCFSNEEWLVELH